nr:unnamed protein product [Digitaria exilis]
MPHRAEVVVVAQQLAAALVAEQRQVTPKRIPNRSPTQRYPRLGSELDLAVKKQLLACAALRLSARHWSPTQQRQRLPWGGCEIGKGMK